MPTPGVRDLVEAVGPPWLGQGVTPDAQPGDEGYWAQRIMYACVGIGPDFLIDRADQAAYARMPTRADPSALPFIGRDRQIVRGFNESDASYAERTRRALTSWRYAGTDRGVLSEEIAVLSPTQPMGRIVFSDTPTSNTWSTWRTYVPGASGQDLTQPPATQRIPYNFDWDSVTPWTPDVRGWWRFWLVLFAVSPDAFAHTDLTWNDAGTWDDGGAWDFGDLTPGQAQTLSAIAAQWKRAGSWCRWIVISFDSTLFDPAQPADGIHNPDGTWGHYGKTVGSSYVSAHPDTVSLIDGAL